MPHVLMRLLLASILALITLFAPAHAAELSAAPAGPVAQWRAKRAGFHATLAASGHESWCDWARFSLLTAMSYTAAQHEARRRHWTESQTNALRHAVWQYQLARAFDPDTAQALGDEQERLAFNERDTATDQHNNRVARDLYEKHRDQGISLGAALTQIIHSIDTQDGTFITTPGD